MEYEIIVKQFLNGLSLVLIIILIALGLSIIFGMMKVINMAHGELFMMGAYVVYAVQQLGGSFLLGAAFAPLVVGLIGLAMERSILRHLYWRQDLSTLLATWGFSVIFIQVVKIIFNPDPKHVDNPLKGSWNIAGAAYPSYRSLVMILAAAIIVAVVLLFWKTDFGILARATIQNSEMASILGINTPRMFMLTFLLGSALAGLAGALMSPLIALTPSMGVDFIARCFFAVIVGGMGGIMGVIGGGALIGEAESLFSLVMIPTAAQILVFVIVVIVMLLRPRGLIKEE